MKTLRNIYFGLVTVALISSCAPKDAEFEIRQPTANFNKYIAVGNSLTAGYADGGLYLEGQRVAFPNLIAEQMQAVGGGAFTSPFFSEEQANGSGYIRLEGLENGRPVTSPVTDRLAIRGQNSLGRPLYTPYSGNIHNYGVPGMRLDLAFEPLFGNTELGNPFFERLLSESERGTLNYMSFTTRNDHTFFTFWLGNVDALGYAMNGAVATPGDPTKVLTEVATFTAAYNGFINALTAQQQKGVVATIPDVTAVPYFTTVTYAQLLVGAKAVNSQIQDLYIETKQGPRVATAEDLFFLTFPVAQMAQGLGVTPATPIHDHLVLDREEVKDVQERIGQFNRIIREVANAKDLAIVDVHAFFNKVKNGYAYNGIPISSAFISGNAFSLDGVHLTPIGNAIVANLFIDEINKKYNASIPKIDVSLYSGVKMPR